MNLKHWLDMVYVIHKDCVVAQKFTFSRQDMKIKKRRRGGNYIQASSLIEVKEGLDNARGRLTRSLKLPGEGFTVGKAIEAFIAYCLTRPHGDQLEMAREGQTIIERLRLLAEPGPALDWDGSTGVSVVPKFDGTDDGGASPKAPVPKRRKPTRNNDRGTERRTESAEIHS